MSDDSEQVILARIESRRSAFEKSPAWFTIWEIGYKLINLVFWVAFWSLVVQCTCAGCVWKPI